MKRVIIPEVIVFTAALTACGSGSSNPTDPSTQQASKPSRGPAAPSPSHVSYEPDSGTVGTACVLLPSAAINDIFGPLIDNGLLSGDSVVNNVAMGSGIGVDGNSYCSINFQNGVSANIASWYLNVGAVQPDPSLAVPDDLSYYLADYSQTKLNSRASRNLRTRQAWHVSIWHRASRSGTGQRSLRLCPDCKLGRPAVHL